MRNQVITLCATLALGLSANACSLLGTYANSAGSMMAQPGAATPGATPVAASSPASTSPSDSPKADEKPAAPSTVSVTLRNGCSNTVKVFFGDKPKFGSGRYSSLSGNSRTNQSFEPGDMIWIVDDGQNGIDSVTVEAGTREIEVASSCDAFHVK